MAGIPRRRVRFLRRPSRVLVPRAEAPAARAAVRSPSARARQYRAVPAPPPASHRQRMTLRHHYSGGAPLWHPFAALLPEDTGECT
jgi:hypothetical protein